MGIDNFKRSSPLLAAAFIAPFVASHPSRGDTGQPEIAPPPAPPQQDTIPGSQVVPVMPGVIVNLFSGKNQFRLDYYPKSVLSIEVTTADGFTGCAMRDDATVVRTTIKDNMKTEVRLDPQFMITLGESVTRDIVPASTETDQKSMRELSKRGGYDITIAAAECLLAKPLPSVPTHDTQHSHSTGSKSPNASGDSYLPEPYAVIALDKGFAPPKPQQKPDEQINRSPYQPRKHLDQQQPVFVLRAVTSRKFTPA